MNGARSPRARHGNVDKHGQIVDLNESLLSRLRSAIAHVSRDVDREEHLALVLVHLAGAVVRPRRPW